MTNNQPPMKIKGFVPWFGAKRAMAVEIVEELGPHTQYFEPFCGSLAVLLEKSPSQKETVCDLHRDLTNLARVIQYRSSAERLYDRLCRVMVTEDLLDQAHAKLSKSVEFTLFGVTPDMAERAYWFFLASWLGRSGMAGIDRNDYVLAVRWTNGGGSPTVRVFNAIESLPAWHRRLQNVVILCRNAFEIIDRFEDSAKTVIYVDSPYHPSSRAGFTAGTKNHYVHEFTLGQHEMLAEVLRLYRRARIVVSHYDCEAVRQLYDGWTFVDKTRNKQITTMATKGASTAVAPEVLIINGPSFATQAKLF